MSEQNNEGATKPRYFFYLPAERFIRHEFGRWMIDEPLTKEGITNWLVAACNEDAEITKTRLKARDFGVVAGVDLIPGNDAEFVQHGPNTVVLNTWVRPTLAPAPAPYPRISRVLDWLTNHDPNGRRWLEHWIAAKVQNPGRLPRVAVVFQSAPAGGKGTLTYCIQQMLGPENTAIIQRAELESRFNARWVNKLFVLADEAVAGDEYRSLSDQLKVLIDGGTLSLEAKGVDQRAVTNRLAWFFASNRNMPVIIEPNDRRYTVFVNPDELPPGYKEMIDGCFDVRDSSKATPEFMAEIAGFFDYLMKLTVNYEFIRKPYENDARQRLIHANRSSYELFLQHVQEHGLDDMLDEIVRTDPSFSKRSDIDWGADKGVAMKAIYACYVRYCAAIGAKPVRNTRLGMAIANHRPAWPPCRPYINGKQVSSSGYIVPRRPASVTHLPTAPSNESTGT